MDRAVSDNLKILCKREPDFLNSKGEVNHNAVARFFNIGQSTVTRIFNANGKSVSLRVLKLFADHFNVTVDQITSPGGVDKDAVFGLNELQEAYLAPPYGNATELGRVESTMPLIGWVKAGEWCESPDHFAPGDAEDWLPRPANAGVRSFALKVQNDSMTSPYPGQRSYPEGTIIYVDPDREIINGCRVVARVNGEYTFKTYVEDGGRKYLKPINPTYDKYDITEDTHICGVIIGSYLPE